MVKIPQFLHEPIAHAFPANVILVGSAQPDGYAQISPRGSVLVYDDEHFSMWERSQGSTANALRDGSKLTLFYRNYALHEQVLGGIARFYGTVTVHKSGPVYDDVWANLIEPEKARDPEKKGFAVLIKVERAEAINGQPLPQG